MGAAKRFEIETACLRGLMMMGEGSLTIGRSFRMQMRSAGLDLCDVNFLLSDARVIASDMIEDRGLWTVGGATVDGVDITMIVAVRSNDYDVEPLDLISAAERGT